ncbi:MAG: hypothetical protein LOY00_12445, partial [Methylocaldum sp.]|nr:hypothetical protein [Methylocaldum sp.]
LPSRYVGKGLPTYTSGSVTPNRKTLSFFANPYVHGTVHSRTGSRRPEDEYFYSPAWPSQRPENHRQAATAERG